MSAVPEPQVADSTSVPGKRPATTTRHVWTRFWVIAKPYWVSQERWKAAGLLVVLVLLLLGQTQAEVLINEQTGEFTSALAARDADRFWASIRTCLYILIVAIPVYAVYYYIRNALGLHWRRWMTHHYLDGYFKNRIFYKLNADTGIDNPDQRISEDINTFTRQSLFFLSIGIGALLQLIAFSAVLWMISRELVYFLVVYAIAGTVVSIACFGRVLIGLNFYQLKREADFRFSLIRVRENAESIAFYRGEPQESSHVRGRFGKAFQNFERLIRWQLGLNMFQYGYGFLTILLPSAIVASRVLDGELEVGSAIRAAGAFAAVLNALTVIVDNFEDLSRFVAGLDRLDTFSSTLTGKKPTAPRAASTIESCQDSRLALEHVTLQTPNQERTLVTDLSASIHAGEGLLIVGASGGGKSSLMRAIAGLWNSGTGRIVRPAPQDMLFLPQHPYMVVGSLRSQLLYPNHVGRQVADDELLQLLDTVNLHDIAGRFGGLDTEVDWSKVLSLGEQQRLTIARVLLARPRYVMLDEATSALDIVNEEALYQLLAGLEATLVSVSHRPTLLKYHHQVLELPGDGTWRLHPARDYRFGW
ncbi:ABC transporter ATP-binding protein/permease [Cupriavidus taiwanensis]|uniref:ABC transporter, ATP-binding component n=2 Tax=Cupriavidus taiwanensis TaxID=164546 RepID=B3R2H8_CUPTR|nr:ABC transporter ATP-binding protein/permease [Cupriavidus taiwanensis]CAQ69696.1 putative ABC transporter, ATP-binding component [Cupriavidus taiwanensis LMG 19424]SOY44853.1 putative ABC transporter, ATP-binding component [Cupriavidus taiwanensis]SOY87784.1 putative ABC transporter, ATP-binding component [Cupriavidus taiwanensis]SOZ05600.1 putative ABC transporter, ATP-binding component [Cupriavidus taiwanensis]SOZ07584.1 putative ABC transporter, ATP-binding component [Cupriavidus taiwane